MLLDLPVLEPNLDLPWAEPGDLSRESLPVSSVGMRLFDKLAHQKTGLLVGQSVCVNTVLQECIREISAMYLNRFIFRRAAVRSAAV